MRRFVALIAVFLVGFFLSNALRKPPAPTPSPIVREVVLVDRCGRFVASLPVVSESPNEDGTVRVFAHPP